LQTGSLFRERVEAAEAGDLPLAARIRPRTLDEFVGQEHLLAPGKPLRVAIERDELHSCIFWGPAGCGKSTLAFIIAGATKAQFAPYSAVSSGVADMRKVIAQATRRRSIYGQRTILFVDEIHRFNKAQQDAFLPFVENGTIILLGSTTENPFFEINSPLISRCRLYTFERLTPDQISAILLRALEDEERGLGKMKLSLDEDALAHMAKMSEGDARVGLNALEVAASLVGEGGHVTLAVAEQALQRRAIEYDKDADSHYDTISAFIKSLRGSDPDAALHYLARMLKAGEDPRFIARRLVVHASEDVGNADPMALVVATSAAHAVEYVGLPEARLALAQATIYIATAPKSNTTYAALDRAMQDVEKRGAEPVPKHLRDSNYPGAARMGHGEGYLYPHSFPGAYVPQEYMPPGLKSRPYYEPSERGYEAEIRRRMKEWRAASRQEDAGSVEPSRAAESPEETERKAKPGE
jgi:putative ATPase